MHNIPIQQGKIHDSLQAPLEVNMLRAEAPVAQELLLMVWGSVKGPNVGEIGGWMTLRARLMVAFVQMVSSCTGVR